MILSVSRRTDIPNYYSEWFLNRVREGFLYVRNPMNEHQISKILITPELTDCIVFWTKNPINFMKALDQLQDYNYYFQFTLTGYGKDMEPGLPDKRTVLLSAFRRLAQRIGKNRVIWRYDPILINDTYTPEYHRKAFTEIAKSLRGYTEKVVISFVDLYEKTLRNTAALGIHSLSGQEMYELAGALVRTAQDNGMVMESCAEKINLQELGIAHGSCIDKVFIENLIGCRLKGKKDKNQRTECGCMESVEVGAYDTCPNGCRYCYANLHDRKVAGRIRQYDVNSPLLCGTLAPGDKIAQRKIYSLKEEQLSLF